MFSITGVGRMFLNMWW